MTDTEFAEREAKIKMQGRRKRNLKKLTDIFHRSKYGDYSESYAEFEETYLAPRGEHIPRYASVAEDETYGMISLHESLTEAISVQADIPSNGEYLNVPAGVYDLDSTRSKNATGVEQIEYRMVAMSLDAYTVLCGLVQDSDEVHAPGIYGPWNELRERFPLKHFKENVTVWDGLSDPPKSGVYYDEEAGL